MAWNGLQVRLLCYMQSRFDLHEQREVPGDNLSADADRLVSGVAKELAVQGDGLPVVLVSPTSVVPRQ